MTNYSNQPECCSKSLFIGLKATYRKEIELPFGDYCEVYDGSENLSKSHSIPCIAVFPCCNLMGSWIFLNLVSKKRVRRLQWKRMVATEEFSSKMYAFMEKADRALKDTPDMADHIRKQGDQPPDVVADKKIDEEPI